MALKIDSQVEEMVLADSANRKLKCRAIAVAAPLTGRLYSTRCSTEYPESLKMIRIGAEFTSAGTTIGAIYGFVFQQVHGAEPPSPELFYDWCDSVSEASADTGRWILDSGYFPQVFQHGDALIITAFDFARSLSEVAAVEIIRTTAQAIKAQHKKVARALFVIDGFSHRPGSLAHRKAFLQTFSTAKRTQLGSILSPQKPTEDLFMHQGKHLDRTEELAELIIRTGLHRRL